MWDGATDVNTYITFLSQSSMSRHVNKCWILYSLDWIARYSSEYRLSVISIVITLCKKVVNKVITYSDHASFTIIISWSPTTMSILTASTPCYQDKLKNGAAYCISPKLQNCIFSFCPIQICTSLYPLGPPFSSHGTWMLYYKFA